MDIPRLIEKKIEGELGKQKVIMLYGTRCTGKTTIIDNIAARHGNDALLLQGEDMQIASLLWQRTLANYNQLTKGKKIVIIDEAQAIPEIGKILKFMIDNVKGISIIATELGNGLQLNKATVERYLDLLSKVFIIFPLTGYSNNLCKEVTKSKKWYFYDNGIRNALINNFSPLQSRNDIGQLWEQYILSERLKFNSYRGYHPQYFFWRTYDGQEIDLPELDNKQHLEAFECKWQNQNVKTPAAFAKAYPDAKFTTIHQGNYLEWIVG